MSRAANPFSSRAVLAMLVVGAAAFLLFLYAVAAGWDDKPRTGGTGHALSNGLNGYVALVRLLERRGMHVSTSRNKARLEERALIILTPEFDADPAKLTKLIASRRYEGPTIVILPKYFALDLSQLTTRARIKHGWVMLSDPQAPRWLGKVDALDGARVGIAERLQWHGFGLAGGLPDPKRVMAIDAASVSKPKDTTVLALVTDEKGDVLAGYLNDDGSYPLLDEASGFSPSEHPTETLWPVVIVAEPDLLNNYGFTDATRARLADKLVAAAAEGKNGQAALPIVFDLTLAGLGASKNLLTLAFEPPFLAATLCLLLAALVIAWRSLRRFGPPLAEAAATAFGKAQLARNAGGLIERSRRLHLLGPPYAALIASRIAARLGVREAQSEARDAAAARLLDARGIAADYPARLEALRGARKAGDLIRAAGALKSIERTLAA